MGESGLLNQTSSTAGYNGTQPCISFCDDNRYSFIFNSNFLNFAPCPPEWNKGLLWAVAKRKGLNDDEITAIASRCFVPRPVPGKDDEVCGVGCIVTCLVCTLCLIMIGLQFYRRRWRQPIVRGSRFGDTSRETQMAQNHKDLPKQSGYDSPGSNGCRNPEHPGYLNPAYDHISEIMRSDSNVSKTESTAELCDNEQVPSGHNTSLNNNHAVENGKIHNGIHDKIDRGIYDTGTYNRLENGIYDKVDDGNNDELDNGNHNVSEEDTQF